MHSLEYHHTTRITISIDAPNSPGPKAFNCRNLGTKRLRHFAPSLITYLLKISLIVVLKFKTLSRIAPSLALYPNEAIIDPSSSAVLLLLPRRWSAIEQVIFLGLFEVNKRDLCFY
jgi:hypothetical protein